VYGIGNALFGIDKFDMEWSGIDKMELIPCLHTSVKMTALLKCLCNQVKIINKGVWKIPKSITYNIPFQNDCYI